jgi:hypothetical protein
LTIEIAGSTEHTNRMPGSQIAISWWYK